MSASELEELLKGCRKVLRVLRVFMEHEGEPLTRYRIEKEAAVYYSPTVLERLLKLGIIRIVGEEPTLYELNSEHRLVKALRRLFEEVGYLQP